MKNTIAILTIIFPFFVFGLVGAEEPVEIIPSGFAYYQVGQVNTSWLTGFDHTFRQQVAGRLGLTLEYGNRIRIITGIEGVKRLLVLGTEDDVSYVSLKEAQGIVSFGDKESLHLNFAIGYFPYKYNNDVKDLGEYLLRSGTYPGYIITDFENAKFRALGLKLNLAYKNIFQNDLLFTSETYFPPYYDFSLSYIADINIKEIISFGCGISFNRLVPVDPEKTTSKDTVFDEVLNIVYKSNGEPLHWSFKGVKVMSRLTFDPKPLIPVELFGTEDLKIYSELAVLGLRNYSIHYPSWKKRAPFMVGFNFPTFKILDVLSLEYELYKTQHFINPIEKPRAPGLPDDWASEDDVKWIVYARKTIFKRFSISGLIGRDHYRDRDDGGNFGENEILRAKDDFYFLTRFMFTI